ncbi:MAG: hypothetical protein ACK4TB_09125 [Gemmobacter sp.]
MTDRAGTAEGSGFAPLARPCRLSDAVARQIARRIEAGLLPPLVPRASNCRPDQASRLPVETVAGALWPMLGVKIVVLGFVTYVPAITLSLPSLLR